MPTRRSLSTHATRIFWCCSEAARRSSGVASGNETIASTCAFAASRSPSLMQQFPARLRARTFSGLRPSTSSHSARASRMRPSAIRAAARFVRKVR